MSPYRTAPLVAHAPCSHRWRGRLEEYQWSDAEYRYFDVRHVAECGRCGAKAGWLRAVWMALCAVLFGVQQ